MERLRITLKFVPFFLAASILFCGTALALVRYVAVSGVDAGNCESSGSPCATVQYAIDRGGTDVDVRVASGTYFENIDITSSMNSLAVSGGWAADFSEVSSDPSQTVMDGNIGFPNGIAIDLHGNIIIDLTIENLTIRGCGAETVSASPFCSFTSCTDGAVIYASPDAGSDVTLRVNDCLIEGSAGYVSGIVAAATKTGETPTQIHVYLDNVGISFPSGSTKAGLAFGVNGSGSSISVTASNIEITGAISWGIYGYAVAGGLLTVGMQGGDISDATTGIYGYSWAQASESWGLSNLIVRQASSDGVALSASDAFLQATVVHATVADSGRYGFYLHTYPEDAITDPTRVELFLRNSIVWGSGTKDLYLLEENDTVEDGETWARASDSIIGTVDWFLGGPYYDEGGVINVDPLFLDPAGGDYHITYLSPAFDAAPCDRPAGTRLAPLTDFEGDARPDEGQVSGCDIGADEYKGFEVHYLSYDFGTYGVNYQSLSRALTLLNSGANPVSVTGMSFVQGIHFVADPAQGPVPCAQMPFVLPEGGYCDIGVSIWPKATGPLFDTLSITSDDPKAAMVPVSFSGSGLNGHPVNVSYNFGGGNVSADPAGIPCNGGPCTWTFPTGTTTTLTATPFIGYAFTGWGGDCAGMNCTLLITEEKNVTAYFASDADNDGIPDEFDNCTGTFPVRTVTGSGFFLYSDHPWVGYLASRGIIDPIKMHAVRFLIPMPQALNQSKNVIFQGGFIDCNFTVQADVTEIPGPIEIVSGTIEFDGVAIR